MEWWEFPVGPVVKTWQWCRGRVQSLIVELKSHLVKETEIKHASPAAHHHCCPFRWALVNGNFHLPSQDSLLELYNPQFKGKLLAAQELPSMLELLSLNCCGSVSELSIRPSLREVLWSILLFPILSQPVPSCFIRWWLITKWNNSGKIWYDLLGFPSRCPAWKTEASGDVIPLSQGIAQRITGTDFCNPCPIAGVQVSVSIHMQTPVCFLRTGIRFSFGNFSDLFSSGFS